MEQKNEIIQKVDDLLWSKCHVFTIGDEFNSDSAITTEDARELAKAAFNLGVQMSADNAEAIHAYPWTHNEPEVNKNSILKLKI